MTQATETLTIIGNPAHLPNGCACCGVPTRDRAFVSKRGEQFPWQVDRMIRLPYCPQCQNHATWFAEGRWRGVLYHGVKALLLANVALILPLALLHQFSLLTPLLRYGASVVCLAVAAWAGAKHYARRPKTPLGPQHARTGWAAEVVGFDRTNTLLRVYSPAFARDYRRVNAGAILPV